MNLTAVLESRASSDCIVLSAHTVYMVIFLFSSKLMTLCFLFLFPLCSLDPGPGVPTVTVHNTTDKRSKCCSFKIFLRLGGVHETIQPHPTPPQLRGLKMNQAL